MWSAGRSAATSSPSSGSGDGSADAPHQHFAQMLVRHSSGNCARRRYRLTLHLRCSCPANPATATIAGWPRRPLSRLSPAAERASRTQLSPRHFRGLLIVTVSSHGPSDSPRQLSFGPAVTTDDSGLFHVPPPISRSDVRHTRCTAGSSSGRPDRPGGMYPLRVGVTMSLHKLTAGSGYDYLTRQVAALGCDRERSHRAGVVLHRTG